MQAIMLCSHLFLFPKRSQRRSAPLSLASHGQLMLRRRISCFECLECEGLHKDLFVETSSCSKQTIMRQLIQAYPATTLAPPFSTTSLLTPHSSFTSTLRSTSSL